jgi:hypothetical protein
MPRRGGEDEPVATPDVSADGDEHEGKIHRVDPHFGPTLKSLIWNLSQTAGSTGKLWVNPVNFRLCGRGAGRRESPRQAPGPPPKKFSRVYAVDNAGLHGLRHASVVDIREVANLKGAGGPRSGRRRRWCWRSTLSSSSARAWSTRSSPSTPTRTPSCTASRSSTRPARARLASGIFY